MKGFTDSNTTVAIDGPSMPDSEAQDLRRRLSTLLGPGGPRDLDAELEQLARHYSYDVYAELIFLVAHLRFAPVEARRLWRAISEHRRSIEGRLGFSIDPRVALINYFLDVERKLTNPKIVEMSLFDRTQSFAYRDELTGLYNFRFFDEHLPREVARSRRSGAPVSLLMIDVDDFKRFNDGRGHGEGNRALAAIAGVIRRSLRSEDIAARYGGEEIAVILPATPKTGATVAAERARGLVEQLGILHEPGSSAECLTVSIGLATFPADAEDHAGLLRRADRALYAAKADGKNRVQLCGNSTRSHKRLELTLAGSFRVLAPESHDLTTLRIGTGGMVLESDRDLPVGSLVEIDLVIPECGRAVRIPGRVVGVGRKGGGTYEAAIRTIDLARSDREFLSRYLFP